MDKAQNKPLQSAQSIGRDWPATQPSAEGATAPETLRQKDRLTRIKL